MAKSREISAGDERAGVRLQYVKGRRTFRLSGWHQCGAPIDAVEFTLQELSERLGIDVVEDVVASPPCLVLAGKAPARDLIMGFATEGAARDLFSDLRIDKAPGSPYLWGELLQLLPTGLFNRLCWFGPPQRQPRSAVLSRSRRVRE